MKLVEKREKFGNLRELKVSHSLIDFASNDYLGLSRSTKLKTLFFQELEKETFRFGSTGSRLLTGNSAFAEELEEFIAKFHGFEVGVLFNCGFMANNGLFAAVANDNSVIIFDSGIHASARQGIRLSQAKAFPFKHNDLEHLERRLKNCQGINCFICIESLYSTDGSLAPLKDLSHLAEKYDAKLIVDEAHAIGVLGPKGKGLVAKYVLQKKVFAQIVTFGKGLGTFGAIVLGNADLKQLLINFAPSFIYTTALPFPNLAAIKCSYKLFPTMEEERVKIENLSQKFKLLRSSPSSHIQPITIQGNEKIKKTSWELSNLGFDVRPLLSPTVQKGHEALRICLHSFNTEREVDTVLHFLINKGYSAA